MKKSDITIVVLLFALLLSWAYFHKSDLMPPDLKQTQQTSDTRSRTGLG